MKFKDARIDFTDPDGDRLTADFYYNDGLASALSTGFLVLCVGRDGYSKAVRMDRKQAKKFAKRILKELER